MTNICNMTSEPNDVKLLVKQVRNEIEKLTEEVEYKLLEHDSKIAECCKYLKDNLSNSIRCLIDDMKLSGELDEIIQDAVIKVNDKFVNIIDPDDFFGEDYEKIESAIYKACSNSNTKEPTIIKLTRDYDITGHSIVIPKPVNRERLVITSDYGTIIKNDGGYIFVKKDTSYVTDIELKDITIRGSKDTKLCKSPDFINVVIDNCKLENFDCLVDSDTYMQNIRLTNSLITGGDGSLFKACGFYGLYIEGNTIEHRSGYVVEQIYKDGNMYDTCYFINMVNNLIEGFISGGIGYFKKISKVNISNNYFENMKNNIVLDTTNNVGVLSVDSNRLFIGSSEIPSYGTKGLVNIMTKTYPEIHAHGNKVENCYLINVEKEFSVSKVINLASNDVTNDNETTDYTENSQSKNHEINVFPLIPITGSKNKYSRTMPVISDKRYLKLLRVENNDVRIVVVNGELMSTLSTEATFGVGKTNVNLYFGFPVFSDDISDIQTFSQDINIKTKYRFGSGDDKYLLVVAENDTDSTKVVTTIATLKCGCSTRG